MNTMRINKSLLIFFFLFSLCYGSESDSEDETPVKLGNLALTASQQPGVFISFGDHIIDKNVVQLYFFGSATFGDQMYQTEIAPSILWGVTDNFSIFFNAPFSPGNKNGPNRSSGIEDLYIDFEYAYFNRDRKYSSDEATLFMSIYFPTGSGTANPPTGFGSYSYFIGATFNRLTVNWMFFTSEGILITRSHDHGMRFGDEYIYQCGIGRNIPSPPGRIYFWLFEFDGIYSKRNIFLGNVNPDSGGNIIYFTPSLWISTRRFLFQAGPSFPIVQNLFGTQNEEDITISANVAWTF